MLDAKTIHSHPLSKNPVAIETIRAISDSHIGKSGCRSLKLLIASAIRLTSLTSSLVIADSANITSLFQFVNAIRKNFYKNFIATCNTGDFAVIIIAGGDYMSVEFRIRLKKIRESRGYKSQQAFANDFGVAQSTVGGWESGSREPPFDTLIRMADFFGVTVDWLLGLVDEESPLAEISEEALDAEIVTHLKALSPEDLKTVDYAVQGILAAREEQASPPAGGHK